jgi:predicted phosphodiesterase
MELTTVANDEAVLHDGVQVLRLTGLRADTTVEAHGHRFRTLPDLGERLATFATVNDVHFGETVCGLIEGADIGPVFSVAQGEPPYPETMNQGAVEEIGAIDAACVVAKGDLTATGTSAEYARFLEVYAGAFGDRLFHVRGNHDAYHAEHFVPDAPLEITLPGVRLAVLDTTDPGRAGGRVRAHDLEWLDALARESDRPVLVFGHHHPWDPGSRDRSDNSDSSDTSDTYFGISPDDSERLVAGIARRPSIRGYFAGHTHRNRVRRFSATGDVPFVEVACVKDYPGSWAEYRVFEAGVLQIHRRISTQAALAWSEKTRAMFNGAYAPYAFGTLSDRCFAIRW